MKLGHFVCILFNSTDPQLFWVRISYNYIIYKSARKSYTLPCHNFCIHNYLYTSGRGCRWVGGVLALFYPHAPLAATCGRLDNPACGDSSLQSSGSSLLCGTPPCHNLKMYSQQSYYFGRSSFFSSSFYLITYIKAL